MAKTEKKTEVCYRCRHFDVRETKQGIRCSCKRWNNNIVGAMWCKFYQPIKKEDK